MWSEKSETVKVVVRCRPWSQNERNEQHDCVVNVDMIAHTITLTNPSNPNEQRPFTFDYTYDWKAEQSQIFKETALPILNSVMEGYNGTIFAYGQTGTGKTFTMEGIENEKDMGIIPRTINWIFDNINTYSNKQFWIRCSMVEIYNEEVRDLLGKNPKAKLNVREKDKVFYLEDVAIFQAENSQYMLNLMKIGRDNRATGATKMNQGSSRSHSIFSIIVENSEVGADGETHYRVGKLNLVDLAGSERQSKTESTGERFKEATKINLSLTILGTVINKWVSGKTQYIPYRDSKLTMLLQDSLGGNTKTVMIANVGPADYNYDESLNTLWYASHAKKIKNKPKINEDPKDALLRQYQEEIEAMKKKLMSMGKGDLLRKLGSSIPGALVSNEDNQIKILLEKAEKEKEEFKRKQEEEIKKIKNEATIAESEKQALINKIEHDIEENKRVKEESKKLFWDYQTKKKQVLISSKVEQTVKLQESEILKHQEELEIKRREEERLKEEVESKKNSIIELKKQYESKQANIDDWNNKLELLRNQIKELKWENKQIEERREEQREAFSYDLWGFEQENKKKAFLIAKFIPVEEQEKIKSSLDYDEKENCYKITQKKALLNNYKTNLNVIKKMKMSKLNSNTIPIIQEQSINWQLEKPDSMLLDFNECHEKLPQEVLMDIDKILTDDDKDLLYYDQELKLINNAIKPELLGISPDKLDSNRSWNTTSSSVNPGFVKPVIKKGK